MKKSGLIRAAAALLAAGVVAALLHPPLGRVGEPPEAEGGNVLSASREAVGSAPAAEEPRVGAPPVGSARTSASRPAEGTVRVHGRVIARDGAPAPAGTAVRLLTMRSEVDFPEAAPAVEEPDGLQGLFVEGAWRTHAEAVFGKEPAHGGRTRADGSFAIEVPVDLPSFRLEAYADFGRARPPAWHGHEDPEVAAGLTLVLEPAGKVEGTLRGPDGSPARGGRVMLRDASGERWVESSESRADSEGRFVMRGVAPEEYEAVSWADGLGTAFGPKVEVRAGESAALDLFLPGESWIAGTVVDEEGRGVAGAFVVSYRGEDLGFHGPRPVPGRIAKTDENGAFRIGSLGAGEHFLWVDFPGLLRSDFTRVQVAPSAGAEGMRILLEKGRTLAGRVVDGEGRAVGGAAVRADTDYAALQKRAAARRVRKSPQRGKCADDGAFRLSGLSDAPLLIDVSLEGSGSASLGDVEPGREDLLLVLRPCGIAGAVRDAQTGEAVPRFTVEPSVAVPQGRPWKRILPRSFRAPDGSFEWPDLPSGTATIGFHAPGFASATLERIEVGEGGMTRGLDIRLARAAGVRGKVVEGGTEMPVVGAEVRWSEADAPPNRSDVRRRATTGADGAFFLGGVPPGRIRIEVDHGEFLPATVEALEVREGELIEGFEVRLDRAGALEGVAIGPDGSPLAGGEVRAAPIPPRGGESSAEVEASGRFRVAGLRTGKYRVEASAIRNRGFLRGANPVLRAVALVEAGRTTIVDFREPTRGAWTVKGKVLRGGKGVAGVSVRLLPSPRGEDPDFLEMFEDRFLCVTGEDGSYALRGVAAGEATLRVEGQASSDHSYPLLVPEHGEFSFDVVLASGAIEGTVVRASDGAPVKWARVAVASTGSGTAAIRASASTDGEGRYRVEGLPPGSYDLRVGQAGWSGGRARKPVTGCAPSTVGPVVLREGEVGRADFALREGGTARVLVTDPEGRPKNGASIRLRRSDGSDDALHRWPLGFTDEEGTATVAGLAPGRYAFLATVEGLAAGLSEEGRVEEGEEAEFRVRLVSGTLVRVRMVVDPGAAPLAPTVHFRIVRGWEIWAPPDERRSGATEAFAQTWLAPGDYTLLARSAGCRDAAVPVRVGSDSPQEVVVRLEREEGAK